MLFVSPGLAEGPLRIELKRFTKQNKACRVGFEYPEIMSAATPEARERMNNGLLRLMMKQSGWPGKDSGFRSLEAYANDFVAECEAFQHRPESRSLYQYKFVTMVRYSPPILSFRCDATEDAGGVHPFGSTFFVNFDTSTGNIVSLNDLLREGGRSKLESLAETVFRRNYSIPPKDDLQEHGFGFPQNHFQLNENFVVGETDLRFLYNTYEIAAGAMPPTEFSIDLALLRGLIKSDWVLEREFVIFRDLR